MVQERRRRDLFGGLFLCKLDGQKLKISLGNQVHWIRHT